MIANWLLENIAEKRNYAKTLGNTLILTKEIHNQDVDVDFFIIQEVIDTLELALFDMLNNQEVNQDEIKKLSAELYRLSIVLPETDNILDNLKSKLKYSCFAVLGDLGISASKVLKDCTPFLIILKLHHHKR